MTCPISGLSTVFTAIVSDFLSMFSVFPIPAVCAVSVAAAIPVIAVSVAATSAVPEVCPAAAFSALDTGSSNPIIWISTIAITAATAHPITSPGNDIGASLLIAFTMVSGPGSPAYA